MKRERKCAVFFSFTLLAGLFFVKNILAGPTADPDCYAGNLKGFSPSTGTTEILFVTKEGPGCKDISHITIKIPPEDVNLVSTIKKNPDFYVSFGGKKGNPGIKFEPKDPPPPEMKVAVVTNNLTPIGEGTTYWVKAGTSNLMKSLEMPDSGSTDLVVKANLETPAPVVGEKIVVVGTLTANGPYDTINPEVKYTLGPNTYVVSLTADDPDWTCADTGCYTATLKPNTTVKFEIVYVATNTLDVEATFVVTADNYVINQDTTTATVTYTVAKGTLMTASQVAAETTVLVASPVKYTVAFKNTSTVDVTNVVAAGELTPMGLVALTNVIAIPNGVICNVDLQTNTWDCPVGTLKVGSDVEITVEGVTSANQVGTVTSSVEVTSDNSVTFKDSSDIQVVSCSPGNFEFDCQDGCDNDGNNLIDCADPACANSCP